MVDHPVADHPVEHQGVDPSVEHQGADPSLEDQVAVDFPGDQGVKKAGTRVEEGAHQVSFRPRLSRRFLTLRCASDLLRHRLR